MSEESVPGSGLGSFPGSVPDSVPQQGGAAGRPKGLLQQMEELMAALNADLSDLHKEAGLAQGSTIES
ncbi:hypothetical protein ACGF3G_42010 [Streptomyces sp. NPDC048179]|uniref:hypothetical protein n=1 Tax=Streptomyces sp. NPDC048179 TaxID=3365506 RepID=UPI003716A02F